MGTFRDVFIVSLPSMLSNCVGIIFTLKIYRILLNPKISEIVDIFLIFEETIILNHLLINLSIFLKYFFIINQTLFQHFSKIFLTYLENFFVNIFTKFWLKLIFQGYQSTLI